MESGLIFNIQRYSIHDGPGIRATVFLKGCPLRCAWCHNPEGISPEPEVVVIENRCIHCGQCRAVCPRFGSLLKKGTGSELTDANATEDSGREVPVPLFQQAAGAAGDVAVADAEPRCIHCGACVAACPADARQWFGRQMSVAEVLAEVRKDRVFYDESAGGATFSGGEPLLQLPFLQALLEACRAEGIHTAVDTSGYAPREALLAVAPLVDLFLYDLKSMDHQRHEQWTGASNAPILDNLIALGGVHANIWIRVPLVPGFNDAPGQMEAIARFVAPIPGVRQVNLLPYHGTAAHKWASLGRAIPADMAPSPGIHAVEEAADAFRVFGLNIQTGGQSHERQNSQTAAGQP